MTPTTLPDADGGQPSRPATELPSPLVRHVERVQLALLREFRGRAVPGISAGLEYQLKSGGKRIRPALAQWFAAELSRPDDDAEGRTLPFALAVELLHNVFLIHDDIEDGDTFRRGQPTLWSAFGVATALNVADYMLAEAYRLVTAVPASEVLRQQLLEIFTSTYRTTVEGQALDLVSRGGAGLTLDHYEQICSRKTGRYLALGWVGAALVAGRSLDAASELWEVGEHLGPAFQICDDLLDLTAGKGRGGEIGCDVREGKPSFLVAFALESPGLNAVDRTRLLSVLGKPRSETTTEDVQWAIDLFESVGATRGAEEALRERMRRGIRRFEAISWIPSRAVDTFRMIADYLSNRAA